MADAGQRQRGFIGASLQDQSLRQLLAVQSGIDDGGGEVVGDGVDDDDARNTPVAVQAEPLAETRIGQGTLQWRVSADHGGLGPEAQRSAVEATCAAATGALSANSSKSSPDGLPNDLS